MFSESMTIVKQDRTFRIFDNNQLIPSGKIVNKLMIYSFAKHTYLLNTVNNQPYWSTRNQISFHHKEIFSNNKEQLFDFPEHSKDKTLADHHPTEVEAVLPVDDSSTARNDQHATTRPIKKIRVTGNCHPTSISSSIHHEQSGYT
ncbi:hypothetical protein O181_065734 [Austropuccinia psidii MF-1]|uniref:Uncharacterized protein n=1 Tax=Austropuccinia psidii MF-1 TaxID=1389203 RepID=A0A9Q3ERL9_9BASI|nr:hypothetical protein [Austropuccinia psidii MF-1]